jgi:hypothetical protein
MAVIKENTRQRIEHENDFFKTHNKVAVHGSVLITNMFFFAKLRAKALPCVSWWHTHGKDTVETTFFCKSTTFYKGYPFIISK